MREEFERIAALESQKKEWITLPQAAQRFGVPLPTLRYHAVRKDFEAYKPDKRTWLVEAQSVEKWVKGRRKYKEAFANLTPIPACPECQSCEIDHMGPHWQCSQCGAKFDKPNP